MKHIPNKKQIQAFEDVIEAINKARKLRLVFYGKQDNLVAYTKEADMYISNFDFEKTLSTGFKAVPFLQDNVLDDSGADDYSCYLSEQDERKYAGS